MKGTMDLTLRVAAILILPAFTLTPAIGESVLGDLPTSSELTVSTIPSNGDLNPYGVAFVPRGFPGGGLLEPGDILVSNFNDSQNAQGTGTTITKIAPNGQTSTFFQGSGLGLTTALGVLPQGFVIVGNLPTTPGTNGPVIGNGSLLVLDRFGSVVTTLASSHLLKGPWDLTTTVSGVIAHIFVSNVLSGTVTRLDVSLLNGGFFLLGAVEIGSGYKHRTDPAALVVGPTGLAYDPMKDVLYVASTGDNKIYALSFAAEVQFSVGKGDLVYEDHQHLHGPLGLALAPNGHLITANGDAVNAGGNANELVEFTTTGQFVAQFQVDPGAGGAAFGLAFSPNGDLRFAAVDDNTNMLDIWDVN